MDILVQKWQEVSDLKNRITEKGPMCVVLEELNPTSRPPVQIRLERISHSLLQVTGMEFTYELEDIKTFQ
jgi:hypothetical protein